MVVMADRAIGVPKIAPISPFCSPRELLADALPLLQPASRISVTEAAEMYLRVPLGGVWGRFDRTVAPYMVEPADTTRSRRFQAGAFVGPKQSGKTAMLSAVALHAVTCDPDPVRIVHMDKKSADQWVEEKLDPMIRNSPEVWSRLGRAREDSTFSRKRFKGMRITIGYPVASFLSSTSQRFVLLTDYDHMPQVLGPKDAPENSPYRMARDRITSFMSRGFVLLESTPAFPVTDPDWRPGPGAPHEMPPVSGGIVRIYNEGTRGRWYWECMDCAGLYEPHFTRLRYDASLDPGEAGARAEMVCPHCGSLTAHRHKVELNRRALQGRGGWLHEGARVDDEGRRALVALGDSGLRETDVASWALNGAAAAFAPWSALVSAWEIARREVEAFGDETALRGVWYTGRGEPYPPASDRGDGDLSVALLRDHASDLVQGVAPSWARFVTVTVDVQGNRFEGMAMAWGEGGRRIVIDRFALVEPPADAPGARDGEGRARQVDPGKYAEDAGLLVALASRVYAVQGAGYGLRPCALAVDFNGPPGWPDNAEKFWRQRRREGQGHLWFLSIGLGGFHQRDRVRHATPEYGSKGKKARSIKLLYMAADRLKDSVLAALARFDGAAGAIHVPQWLSADHLAEFLAEKRSAKGYELRAGQKRNESLDLAVQALALAEHKGLNRIDWESPPDWAVGGADNAFAVALSVDGGVAEGAAPVERRQAMPETIGWLRR
jgi:phage terminase large subunit GpA-like protein